MKIMGEGRRGERRKKQEQRKTFSSTKTTMNKEAYMDFTMYFNKREIAGFRKASIGAVRCSAYLRIDHSLEFYCICYEKEKWRIVTDIKVVNKVAQPMDPLQSLHPLPALLPK